MYGITKPNIEVSDRLYKKKSYIAHIVYQENCQSIPPYFIALGKTWETLWFSYIHEQFSSN